MRLLASWMMPSHTNPEIVGIFLRWVHILAAITWVGLIYFFNFVNIPFMKQLAPETGPRSTKN